MDELINGYFEWMYNLVCDDEYLQSTSYRKLLMELFNIDFYAVIDNDNNRAEDGLYLRHRYTYDTGYFLHISDKDCSVLEMLIALAIRCEEDFMDDPSVGNRVGQWFWTMIVNLGLGIMTDNRFNPRLVQKKINYFLKREYSHDGKGGLFAIENCEVDLRTIEIWQQACWYIDTII